MAQKQVGSASIAITKLLNGTNQYIFIRYSANSNGNPMTEKPVSGTKYMGVYTSTQNVASVDYNDYSWALFKGQDGESTVSGVLTDEFITVNTDSDGNNGDFSKATTSIMLFEGSVENTGEWEIQVTTESGVNGTYNSDTATYKVTSLTVDTGTITFTATKDGSTVVKNATVQKIKPGADGVDGVGVDSTIIEYQKSAISDKIPTGNWSTVLPTLVKGDFIWTRTTINFTDNSSSISYTVGFIGFDGDDGDPGNDGNGIEKTEIHYQSGSSGTTVPSGTWSLEIPEVAQTQYLWTRTRITYTDQMTSTSYSVGRMGEQGPKGDPAKLLYLSVSSNVMQFNSNNQAIEQTINITAKLQNVSGNATFRAIPYIGTAAQTAITLDGTANVRTLTSAKWTNKEWTAISVTASLGSLTDTVTISKIREGGDGQTSHTHIGYSWSPDGTDRFTPDYPGENYVLKSKEGYTATGNGNNNQYPSTINNLPFNPDVLGKEATIQYKVTISNYVSGTYLRLKMFDAVGVWASFGAWDNISGNSSKICQWKGTLPALKPDGRPELDFNTDLGADILIEELQIKEGLEYQFYTPAPSEDYENAYPKYQGIYSDFNKEQSLDPAKYTWSKILSTPYTHTAYSWSPDGTDRFCTEYPRENLLKLPAVISKSPEVQPYQSTTITRVKNTEVLEWGANDAVQHTIAGNTGNHNTIVGVISIGGQVGSTDTYWGHSIYVKNIGSTILSFSNNIGKIVDVLPNESKRIEMVCKPSAANASRQFIVYRKKKEDTLNFIIWHAKIEYSSVSFDVPTIYTPSPSEDYENAYPKYIGTYSDFSTEQSLDPTRYTWARIMGESNIVGLLTNEAITVSANAAGSGVLTSQVSGTFKVYDGLIDVTSKATFAVEAQTNGVFAIDAKGVYSMSSMRQANDTSTATLTATYKGVTIEKVLTVTKSKTGNAGADSTSYWLLLSSQVLSVPKGTTTLVPANFTVTPMKQTGTAAAAAFSARIIIDETTDGTTWTNKYSSDSAAYTYTPSSANIRAVRVQMKLNASSVLLDQKSVNIVTDGINGAPGQDGSSSYTWIRYSENANGNPMTTIPNKESRYIGIAITSSNIAPTSYAAYTWARIKGDGGLKNRLYTETGANVNQDPIEIFNETQSDGDTVTPENITWYAAKESTNKFSAIGSNSRNLVRNSSDEWSTPITAFSEITNYCVPTSFIDLIDLKVGDKINVYMEVEYSNIVAVEGHGAAFWMQGKGNITAWSGGAFPGNMTYGRIINVSGSGTVTFKYATTISADHLKNDYWNAQLRFDYVQSGSVRYRRYKVEKSLSGNGEDYTPWTPAPGKDNDVYTGQPNLLFGTEESKNIDVDTTSYIVFDPYFTDGKKTLAEQGYSLGDKIRISAKWSVSKNKDLPIKYGSFKAEGFQFGVGYTGSFSSTVQLNDSNTSGFFTSTVILNQESLLKSNVIRFRIDNSTLNFSVDEVKIEPGILETPWAPSLGDNRGIFLTKNSSIIVSPSYFLNENSTTFRADVDYGTMKSSDQITITNKAFDAMRPLILRQPVAPKNPYPGLLWMDTSSDDNYIYRWGKTPREELNGLKYTHYAYANELEGWKDFSVYYPNRNLIINGSQYTKESPFLNNAKTPDGIMVLPNTYSILKQGSYTFNCETDGNWYAHNTSGTDPALRRANIYLQGTKSGATAIYKGANGKMPFQFTISADEASYTWEIRTNTYGNNTVPSNVNFWNFKIEQGNLKTLYLPSPEDEPDKAYMNFVGTYVDKTPADSLDPNKYTWSTLNDPVNYTDDSGNQGIEEEDFVTVYDWGWIILTEEEKEGIPWLNNEDGSTIIDWIYQITQNTSDSSIVNKVIGSEDMKNVYASSDVLNELVVSNDELAQKMNEYNQIIQDYASQINSTYENMTEMQQTIDKFLFNIESAGGVNILKNSTGFQYDDETKTFYQWTKELVDDATIKQEMGNQTLNDLGFVSGFRINGRQLEMYQDVFLPAADIEYTMSGFISKQTTGNAPNNFSIRIINLDNGQEISSTGSTEDINTMSKFSTTFTSPTVNVRIVISLTGENESGSSILVAGLMLNIGPFPLSWQSHHEEVYSTNVRMDSSGLKVFNNDYEGYNVITPKEFAGYYKTDGEDYEKVFTLNQDTTEVKKLQAEERFMMKPIQIVSIESETTPGWAFVGYGNDNKNNWNPNLLYNVTIPQAGSDQKYWPQPRGQSNAAWADGTISRVIDPEDEKAAMRVAGNGSYASYRFGSKDTDNITTYDYLAYNKGLAYTLSMDLRFINPNGEILKFRSERRTLASNWTGDTTQIIPANSSWKRFSWTLVVPTDSKRFYMGVQIYDKDGTTFSTIPTSAYFEFKNPKLERGSTMTL